MNSFLKRVVVFLCACVLSSIAQATDKFIFAWPSAINSGVAPLSFAKKLGYWDQEDLDLEVQVLTGSGVIVPQLLTGNIDGAYSSLETLVIARQPGKLNFPIIFPYNYLRNSIWEFAVLEDSDIESFEDMKGKTIGVLGLSSGNIYMTHAILESKGISKDDINLMAVGTGAAAFDALKTKQIDVLNLFDTAHVRAEQNNIPIRRIALPQEFQGVSSHGISVTQKLLEENPDLVARFGRALTKGTIACQANLDACIRAYWDDYPAMRPAEKNIESVLENEKEVLKKRMENLTYFRDTDEAQFGEFSDYDWDILIKALEGGGEVSDPNIPYETLFSNALVPQYNDFDVDVVIEQAKGL